MSGANDDQKHALANFLFLNYPDFFYHLEVATTEQSSGISLPTPPSNTRSITQPSQGAQRSERNPKQSQSRQEPSGNDNARDEDIFQFVNFPPNSEDLENAKSRIGKQYHEGLEIILGKDLPTDVFVNLDNITFVVRAGYAALRPDLKRFTDEMLYDEIWRQCSIDMMHVGIEKDPETRTMLRRVAQIRMYYWYEEQVKRVREMQPADTLIFSDDILEKATYTLLERFYSAWKITDHVSREELRKTFEAEKEVGKKWCELEQEEFLK
ncbi:hypothetical protein AARAC_010805 [Aspergillus arachidicola]|uniref:Uncharacterized protein n=1 Tax=Aspergillus arachidicola TaxID=656916 RepID=A0A2G7G8X6_9EURO|nr:hypothetical protein AARAC_010805 [Aspergillus arachidicola]